MAEICDNCRKSVPPVFEAYGPPQQVDGGLTFDIAGHYGGFVDHFDDPSVVLCHDCCQLMWAALPGLAQQERFRQ